MRIVCRVLPRDHKQYCKKCAIGLLFHADGFCWRLVFFVVIFHLALAFFSCGLERTLFGSFVLTRQCTEAMKQVPNICIHNSNSCICEIWEFTHTRVLYIHRFANAYHVVCLCNNMLFKKMLHSIVSQSDFVLCTFKYAYCHIPYLIICILHCWVILPSPFFGQWKSTAFAYGKPRAKPEPCATWHSVTCLRERIKRLAMDIFSYYVKLYM